MYPLQQLPLLRQVGQQVPFTGPPQQDWPEGQQPEGQQAPAAQQMLPPRQISLLERQAVVQPEAPQSNWQVPWPILPQ